MSVQQGEQQLANALAHGDKDAERAARKVLAASRQEAAKSRRAARGEGEQARRTPPEQRQAPPRERAVSTREMREWAVGEGYDVPARGVLPPEIVRAYEMAHGG